MIIREALDKDIQEILKVLKASLGETSSKKTEEVWRYKHVINPFGKSLVLIAEEENKIIGVRAFMRWQWKRQDKLYSSFRAVDTATHPEHQGKGVFKKLTLKALEIAQINGNDFIFNTPNSLSKPGYLKMGWEEIGNIRVQIVPVNPLMWKKAHSVTGNKISSTSDNYDLNYYNLRLENEGTIFTPKDKEFLYWRYETNPLQKYLIQKTKNNYLAAYIKKHRYCRELRVSEIIDGTNTSHTLKKQIFDWAHIHRVHFISFSSNLLQKDSKFMIKGKFGPVLTLKNLNLDNENYNQLSKLNSWNYSLGDLELF